MPASALPVERLLVCPQEKNTWRCISNAEMEAEGVPCLLFCVGYVMMSAMLCGNSCVF